MPRRILIVDDENTIRTTLRIIFEEAGYQILTSGTPAEALRLFRTEPLDMVLLDYRLPDNGETVGPEMSRINPEVPIVVLSGDPEAGSAISFAAALIAKPIQPEQLLKEVARVFDGRPPRGGAATASDE
jgi:DNA-binding NtrC family response regulator